MEATSEPTINHFHQASLEIKIFYWKTAGPTSTLTQRQQLEFLGAGVPGLDERGGCTNEPKPGMLTRLESAMEK